MEIKDVLHFYVGQWVTVTSLSGSAIGAGFELGRYVLNFEMVHYILSDHMGIRNSLELRRLSDMTEEELKQTVASEWGTTHTFTEHYCKKKIAEMSKSSYGLFSLLAMYGTNQSLPYLLKQGFDLFGLIDAGLAIDNKSL